MRKFYLILVGAIFFSCNNSSQEKKTTDIETIEELKQEEKEINAPKKVKQSIIDNVEFDFNLEKKLENRMPKHELKGVLKNNNKDTVYFLSQTCYSEYASLQYDESKFMIWTGISCYVSNPIVYKIAPNEEHRFEAGLDVKQKTKTIKLGFDFYAVTKDFVLNTNDRINIFDRPEKEKTIIWAKEKSL